MTDHPFYEVTAAADKVIKMGGTVYQKFTCSGCGNRLTMPVENTFYKVGTCDNCDAVTNIEAAGCNYLVLLGFRSEHGDKTAGT